LFKLIKIIIFDYVSDEWRSWLNWLAPYFRVDPILPYTLLALLTEPQLSSLLACDEDIASYFPLDGLLACTRFHAKSTPFKV